METWRAVAGFGDAYEVSDQGRVRSCGRWLPEPRIKAQSLNPNGYMYVSLSLHNKNKGGPVHRFVAKAFIENPNGLPEVNHIDGNKLNNNVSNLEWTTRSANAQHAVDHGLMPKGSKCSWAKLNEMDVMHIRYMHCILGYSQKELGRMYGLSSAQSIVDGRAWRAA